MYKGDSVLPTSSQAFYEGYIVLGVSTEIPIGADMVVI